MIKRCAICDDPCLDLYMVKDEVWPFEPDEVCHIRCLDSRVTLKMDDFTDMPVNEGIRFGFSLRERLV